VAREKIDKYVQYVVIIIAAAAIIREIVLPVRVTGNSMLPSYQAGDFLLVERVSYRFRSPRTGEVVVFFAPPRGVLIKRVCKVRADDAVYVLGDNSEWSNDSRSFGYVPRDYIIGRAIFIYFPRLERVK